MKHEDKVKAILQIRPESNFQLIGDDLIWQDENQTEPTETEIQAGWIAHQSAQIAEAEAKATQRQAILDRLGLTAEEARLLLG